MGDRAYAFDANTLLSDNAAAYAATGYSQAYGADGFFDTGGNQSTSPKQQARIDAMLVIDVTAIKISAGNESYRLSVLLSNDPAFGAGNVEMAGEISLGKGGSRDGVNMIDSVVGRYELGFSTEQANVKYQYVKLRNTLGGTAPSINYQAFVAVLPDM